MASWWIKLKAVFTTSQFRVFTVRNRMVGYIDSMGIASSVLSDRSRRRHHSPSGYAFATERVSPLRGARAIN